MLEKKINITGVNGVLSSYVVADVAKKNNQILMITFSDKEAQRLAKDLSFFTNMKIYILPDEDDFFTRYETKNRDKSIKRMEVLKAFSTDEKCIVIAPVLSAIKKNVPRDYYLKRNIKLKVGQEIDIEALKSDFVKLGYERMSQVSAKGQFSVRGGIIDIFALGMDEPCRIELFDTEIDSMRSFDIETQRSIGKMTEVSIFPSEEILKEEAICKKAISSLETDYNEYISQIKNKNRDVVDKLIARKEELQESIQSFINLQYLQNYIQYFYDETDYLWDYIQSGCVVIDQADRVMENLALHDSDLEYNAKLMLQRGEIIPKEVDKIVSAKDFLEIYATKETYILTNFAQKIEGIETLSKIESIKSREMIAFDGNFEFFLDELQAYIDKDYEIHIVVSSKEKLKTIKGLLEEKNIKGNIVFHAGALSAGFDMYEEKVCYITDVDIFSHKDYRKIRSKKRKNGEVLHAFSELQVGDYVVHESHGIGQFAGIETLEVQGKKNDYIKLQYSGSDLLYVPVEQLDIVQKYIGSGGNVPKLNKLYDGKWKKSKQKAQKAIDKIAEDLVELYAQRSMQKGYAFSEDSPWQKEFEEDFEFIPTDDQIKCTQEIKKDMESELPMDRLLCGDVGYGKTEVAARAIFKCLVDCKQAAILVPTTILANQHYITLKERFEKFPFNVEMISRFRTKAQQNKIIQDLKSGNIDLIIGTHRLLSKDIEYKDLGLLVIDEEQRFGVRHKEKIKEMKKNIDVLTLSATPIPRTLNMSLTGVKEISVIEEPPQDRIPVQTYVVEQDFNMIKDIIRREMGRGGQVFIVKNLIDGVEKVAGRIEQLVPEARVQIGHGRMTERQLEKVMMGFVNGDIDVLVATAIVESGIDIPNANTMIILDADRFGLAQLYQLKGRVGRSNKHAYAYLMYEKSKVMTEISRKRLKAIRDFTEFGSGFKIAMKDLEFRGAGNMLGNNQSGHIMDIGYELYCKMVNDAVKKLQGEVIEDEREKTTIEFSGSLIIPNEYIDDEGMKLQMYQKIANVTDKKSKDELVEEFNDRFGKMPKEVVNLVNISYMRVVAGRLCIKDIKVKRRCVSIYFEEKNNLTAKIIAEIVINYGKIISINAGNEPIIKIEGDGLDLLEETISLLEDLEEKVI